MNFLILFEFLCVDHDDCTPDPCQNEGVCEDLVNDYNCTCTPGWEGKDCAISRKLLQVKYGNVVLWSKNLLNCQILFFSV